MDNIQQPKKQPCSAVDVTPQHSDVSAKLAKSWWLRWLYIALAWLCILVAILGIFIPGLPPFDFLLLASFFCSKRFTAFISLVSRKSLYRAIIKGMATASPYSTQSQSIIYLKYDLCGHDYYLENPTPVVSHYFNCVHGRRADLDVAQSLSFYNYLV